MNRQDFIHPKCKVCSLREITLNEMCEQCNHAYLRYVEFVKDRNKEDREHEVGTLTIKEHILMSKQIKASLIDLQGSKFEEV